MAGILPFLYIAESPKRGRGVFTAQAIPAESTIELCPVIIIDEIEVQLIHQTILHDYYFLWGDEGKAAIALGYGSLYNHATAPNAEYEMQLADRLIRIFAKRDIAPGEEITISYSEDGLQQTELWFDLAP